MKASLWLPSDVRIIEGALEGLVCANVVCIELGLCPTSPLDAGVRYQREPSGFEDWNIALRVFRLKQGDCEDLASWTAAGYRARGEDDGARAVLYRTGSRMFHCVCELSTGEIVDVCPELGMGRPKGHRVPRSPLSSTNRHEDEE